MQRYVIVAFREGEPDRHFTLAKQECIIGRASEADFVLPHTTISRQHAALCMDGENVFIEDRGSTNGIFLNGAQVQRAPVKEGDFLAIGAYTMVLRAYNATGSPPAPRGKTLCIDFDAAKRLHEEFLEKHSPTHFLPLYRATLLLGARLPMEKLLSRILELVLEALGARRGAVVLHQNEFHGLEVAASLAAGDEPGEMPPSRTLIDYVLRTRTAMLTEDAQSDPRFSSSDTVVRHKTGSAMCTPLCGASKTVGAFYVDKREGEKPFKQMDLGFVTAIGHLVGVALENKHIDEERAKEARLAELGRAVAGISHDLRSVFTGIKGGADLLELALGSKDEKGAREAARLVKSSTNQADAYMSDLLVFVRKTGLNRTPTAIESLIQDVLDALRRFATERKVELGFHPVGLGVVSVDAAQLHRVLTNIVKNGIDACEKGGSVTVVAARRADALTIQINDSGIGMEQEQLRRLSEPFYSTKGRGGTGLGLAISYRIVEQHGGSISVASAEGRGSAFTVFLPAVFPQDTPVPRSASEPSPDETLDGSFKKCPGCGALWMSQEIFLADPLLTLAGYQARHETLPDGLFLFHHECGTTLAVRALEFQNLCQGQSHAKSLAKTGQCPDICADENDLRPCPEDCSHADLREALRIVREWPKSKRQE